MKRFQTIFEEKVEELLNKYNSQTFFVFRGFGIEQIKYLVKHPKSVLQDKGLINNEVIDISLLDKSKKVLNRNLMNADGNVVGFYEELIALCTVIKDLSLIFDGNIVIVNNNLFPNAIPSCISYEEASNLFDYMQLDKNKEDDAMELLSQYYSDSMVLNNEALLYPINVHKDLGLQVIDFFAPHEFSSFSNTVGEKEILIGTESDYLFRLSILNDTAEDINIKCVSSGAKEKPDTLIAVLEHLDIPYSVTTIDAGTSDFEYDAGQFLGYLKKYWGANAEFRDLEFYSDPNISKDIKVISQGSLVSEIVDQCEMALSDEMYRDIFITAPTGAGKSLLFQLPALYIAEKYNLVTIVISPLIALMNDQVSQLEKERGVKIATCINSSISFEERQNSIEDIRSGKKSIVYLAPELLLSTGLQTLLGDRRIGLLVIDEAHTVTSWGRDFRTDYWFLGDFLRTVKKNGMNFPVLCLTATAVYSGVDDVVNDTIIELDLENPILHLGNVKRKNIKFDITCKDKNVYDEKLETVKKNLVLERVREYVSKNEKTLAYCPYKSHVDSIYNELSRNEKLLIRRYYGGLLKPEKSLTEVEYRERKIISLICTKAFGMGVDRSDIKHIVHFAPTGNLADYVQKIGRAARDPAIEGIAHMDFFYGDMRYVRALHGMSELNQFQLKAMLKKIVNIYETKKHRNMLIAPDSFSHLFGEKELETKVKSGLLMLSKDLKYKYGFPVLIVRPRVMLTRIFVSVPDSLQSEFNEKFGDFSKKIGKIPDKYVPNPDGSETKFSYPGTVYSLRVGDLWEQKYSDLSFGTFKYQLFDPTFMQDRDGNHLAPRMQVNINYYKPFSEVQKIIIELLDAVMCVLSFHKKGEKKSFDESTFSSELNEQLGANGLDRNQIGMLLDMLTLEVKENTVFQQNRSIYKILQKRKKQNSVDSAEYIVMGNYSMLKNNMLRLLSQCFPNDDLQYHSYVPYSNDKSVSVMPILKLLEIVGLASYDLRGGENAEIFLRINDPDKIKRLANSKYQNDVLREIRRKHKDSQELMRKFFTTQMSDENRWDFIESYFLGREDELELYLSDSNQV